MNTATGISAEHFSFINLFFHATFFVQIIMVILILASLCSIAIIVQNFLAYRPLLGELVEVHQRLEKDDFLENLAKEDARQSEISYGVARDLAHVASIGAKEFSSGAYEDRYHYIKRLLGMRIKYEENQLGKGLSLLATIGSVSPFIGLLGTVVGIIHSFTAIAGTHQTSLAVVAPGIAEALFATALGLVAAIPATVFYNRYVTFLNGYMDRLEVFVEELLVRLVKPSEK